MRSNFLMNKVKHLSLITASLFLAGCQNKDAVNNQWYQANYILIFVGNSAYKDYMINEDEKYEVDLKHPNISLSYKYNDTDIWIRSVYKVESKYEDKTIWYANVSWEINL